MLHHYVNQGDAKGATAAHWAAGQSAMAAKVLIQISNEKADQVRIPMPPAVARTFVAAIAVVLHAPAGTSLRVPVAGGAVRAENGHPGDGYALYSLGEGRIRVDFHWERAFTALILSQADALAFAGGVSERIARVDALETEA